MTPSVIPLRKAVRPVRRDSMLDLIQIFEPDRQVVVVNRPRIPVADAYLQAIAARLGSGFRYAMKAEERFPAHLLPEHPERMAFAADIDFLIEIFCDLLGCPQVGVRLEVMQHAMCPRFHIDHTGIRLLCTYRGPGTEWLEDSCADRSKLGPASAGIEDEASGIILDPAGIHRIAPYAIALLKGTRWQGNSGRGVIHRSPQVPMSSGPRIMLALDGLW